MQCCVPLGFRPLHAVPSGQQPPCWQQIGASGVQHAVPSPKPGQPDSSRFCETVVGRRGSNTARLRLPNGACGGQQRPLGLPPNATPPQTIETGPAMPPPPFQQHLQW